MIDKGMPLLGPGLALGCALVWAIAVILFRRLGDSLSPFALNFFKNGLMVALMLPTLLVRGVGWQIPPFEVFVAGVSGILGIGIADTLYFRGLNQIGAARTGLAGIVHTPFVIVLAWLFLRESVSVLQVVGMVGVLGGIVWLNLASPARGKAAPAADASMPTPAAMRSGTFWVMFSVALMAVGIVLMKPVLVSRDFFQVVFVRVTGGWLSMLAWGLFTGQVVASVRTYRAYRNWGLLLGASFIGTYMGMLLWMGGIRFASAPVAAVLTEMNAVFLLVLSSFFLHERLARKQWPAALLALGSVGLVVWPA